MRHKLAYGINPKFLDKAEAVAFQAADFAGWKIRASVEKSLKADHTLDKGIRLLQSIEVLKAIPKSAGVLNGDILTRYCQHRKIEEREG